MYVEIQPIMNCYFMYATLTMSLKHYSCMIALFYKTKEIF